ncbi:ROK family protein [Comamonas sp. GB3 AK4-5]|uniref:ROK family protein n=1 Tax=Comamonas sp. GB3 AK4-5 TaxID=3231487 RepID=UPI00351EE59B
MDSWSSLAAGEQLVLESLFWSKAASRNELALRLRQSKSKANTVVAALIAQGLVAEVGHVLHGTGRPAEMLRISDTLGVLLAIDIGATSMSVAVLTPNMSILALHSEEVDVRDAQQGPTVVLARARTLALTLLERRGKKASDVLAIGIGVPGPVNMESAQLVNPPLMPGWGDFSIRDFMRDSFSAPVFVDNDMNIRAIGELRQLHRSVSNFLVVKVGTGIGCGIVCEGKIYRGATGSAGDVGHICVDINGPRCHCGNVGCVEAMAARPAVERLAQEAMERGDSEALQRHAGKEGALDLAAVGAASREGDVVANRIIQRSGMLVGQMLASVVNFFNPSHVFLTGSIVTIGPLFLAAVRQSIYQRSLALSTRNLHVQYTSLGDTGGITGAGVLAMQELLKSGRLRP